MPSIRRVAAVAGILALLPGCLTLYTKTEVIETGEARKPVQFECEEASTQFHAGLKKCNGHLGGEWFGVPFVTVYARERTLSDAGKWNDAVRRSDTDQNGVVTLVEAKAFAQAAE